MVDVPPTHPQSSPARKLVRPTDDRHLGGVCSGVARYLGVDPLPVRVIWAIVALGGAGIPAYLVAWVLIPDDDGTQGVDAVKAWFDERSLNRHPWLIGIAIAIGLLWLGDSFNTSGALIPALLIGGGLYLLLHDRETDAESVSRPGAAHDDLTETGQPSTIHETVEHDPRSGDQLLVEADALWDPPLPPPPPAPPPPRAPRSRLGRWALGLLVLGLGSIGVIQASTRFDPDPLTVLAAALLWCGGVLVVSAWYGRARGLLVAGGLLLIAITAGSAFSVPLRGGFGERTVILRSAADVDEDGHRLLAGQLELDVRDLETNTTDPIRVEASVAMGELIILVRPDQAVDIDAHVDAGQIVEEGRSGLRTTAEEGVGIDVTRAGATSEFGPIEVELDVGLGEIIIRTTTEETQ